jgi:hypothetical protein
MMIRLLPTQVREYRDIIDITMERAFPETAMETKTAIFRDIIAERAEVWFYLTEEERINLCCITRINDDYNVGRKTMTVIALYAMEPTTPKIFMDGFRVLKRYATAKECFFLDFYTDNPKIKEYAEMFDILWKCNYYQLRLGD